MDTVSAWVNLLNAASTKLTDSADCNQHRARHCANDRFWHNVAR